MNKDFKRPDFDSDEQEILSLLKNIHSEEAPAPAPSAVTDPVKNRPQVSDDSDTKWLLPLAETPPPKSEKPKKVARPAPPTEVSNSSESASTVTASEQVKALLKGLLPMKGDPRRELIRKTALLLSLAVFLCSLGMLLHYMVLEPRSVQNDSAHYADLYYDNRGNEDHRGENTYPVGMQANFKRLYDINPDIAGWLSYQSADSDPFMKIDLPVVYCGDNDTYLTRAFDGSKSRSGTLFFDAANPISPNKKNKVNIIYGHNMASGLMFAPLNRLISNVYYARSASTLTMNTLYDNGQYQVFAVVVLDEDADDQHYFNYLRTSFTDDADFLNYIQQVRARSLYDYPVSVKEDDQILVLSTCTNRSQVKVKNGRLAVFARRTVTTGSNTEDARIEKNEDVIMPYAWYTAQNLTPHPYYDGTPDNGQTTETTDSTASTTVESTTATTDEELGGRTHSLATTANTKTQNTGTDTKTDETGTTDNKAAVTETGTAPSSDAVTTQTTAAQEDPV